MLDTELNPWPLFSHEESEIVKKVILSNRVNYWTGIEGKNFETEFAKWSNSNFAIALANGTLALEAALKALLIQPGDEVIVTPRSFIASASSVINVGAKPVFADIDLESGNLSASTIEPKITNKTKAIICVHLNGWPCDMDPIIDLAKKNNIYLVEDCAQAHGAKYKNNSVGSLGDVAAWSFCQDKIMTTGGEGGMLTTNNEQIFKNAWSVKDHGKTIESMYEKSHPPGFRWVHDKIGSNYRMTEMQAAIGRYQLTKIQEWNLKRNYNANKILSSCNKFSKFMIAPKCPNHSEHAWYKCNVYVKQEMLNNDWSRDRIISEINALGVPCRSGSCSEIYKEKAFQDLGIFPKNDLINAQVHSKTSIVFLVHPSLSKDDLNKTCNAIENVMMNISE